MDDDANSYYYYESEGTEDLAMGVQCDRVYILLYRYKDGMTTWRMMMKTIIHLLSSLLL